VHERKIQELKALEPDTGGFQERRQNFFSGGLQ
jgi:hypothetical protein